MPLAHLPLDKGSCHSLWEHSHSDCCLTRQKRTPLPQAERGKPAIHPLASGDSCPCPKSLLFPPLPGKYPDLFHSSLERPREIPPSKNKVRSVQAGHLLRDSTKLTFKAARAGPRPAPVLVPAHSFLAGPHLPPRASLQALLPRAMYPQEGFLVGLFFTPPPYPFKSNKTVVCPPQLQGVKQLALPRKTLPLPTVPHPEPSHQGRAPDPRPG